MDLYTRLVKAAHAQPELRAHLLPLLEKRANFERHARRSREKVLFSTAKMRVSMGRNSIMVEEMPGKPVKRQVRQMLFGLDRVLDQGRFHGVSSAMIPENLLQDAKLTASMNYDKVVGHIWTAIDLAIEKMIERSQELAVKYPEGPYSAYTEEDIAKRGIPSNLGYENMISWLEVEPMDYKPVDLAGKGFHGTSEWHEFTFYQDSDRDDYMSQMEGMRTFYTSKSKGAARKLFKWMKRNPEGIRNMDSADFKNFLKKAKIGYRYVPTVWR